MNRPNQPHPSGYYWCDHCDDTAHGAHCWNCHLPSRFIENPTQQILRDTRHAADEDLSPRRDPNRIKQFADELFAIGRRLREESLREQRGITLHLKQP